MAYDSLSLKKYNKLFCSLNQNELKSINLDFNLTIPTKEDISVRPTAPPPPSPPSIDIIEMLK